MVQAFAKVREETRGQFDIRSYPSSVLGGTPAMFTQHRLGALEMMATNGGTIDSTVPIASIEGIAYAFHDHKTALAAMDGDLGKLVRDEFPAHGFVALERPYENGFRHFTTAARPIRRVEDLQGLKMRVSPGKLFFDTFRSLGVSSEVIASAEVYTALQTHLVDGQETPLLFIETERYYEVQKYCSLSKHMWTSFWMTINRDKWNSLPHDFQEILRKHVNAGALLQRRDSVQKEGALQDKLHRQGLTFNDVDIASFKAKLVASGYYGRWRETYGAAAWSTLEKYAGPLG